MKYFKIVPKHWWYRITRYRALKAIDACMGVKEQEIYESVQKQFMDYILYGNSAHRVKWTEFDEKVNYDPFEDTREREARLYGIPPKKEIK